jgi:hypothetical protein
VKPRLLSRPLLAFACLALVAPVAASAADPSPAPLAAPSNPAPVAATPAQPSAPPASPRRTYTPARTYTPPATVAPSGPTPAQRAAAQRARQQAKARKAAAARSARHQIQLLAAAQTHAEAVLRAELKAARETNAVDLLAGSVAESIGAVPAGERASTATASAMGGSGGSGASIPLPALVLAACAGLLGIGAAFASRRGVGFATAALSILALLLAGI